MNDDVENCEVSQQMVKASVLIYIYIYIYDILMYKIAFIFKTMQSINHQQCAC